MSEKAPAAMNNHGGNRDGTRAHLLGGCTQAMLLHRRGREKKSVHVDMLVSAIYQVKGYTVFFLHVDSFI